MNVESEYGNCILFSRIFNDLTMHERKAFLTSSSEVTIMDDDAGYDFKDRCQDIYCNVCLAWLGWKVFTLNADNFYFNNKYILIAQNLE
tara:strand:- start:22 stop:288 length:267 start_codon:yes stop_codon:yes gene_type:complete